MATNGVANSIQLCEQPWAKGAAKISLEMHNREMKVQLYLLLGAKIRQERGTVCAVRARTDLANCFRGDQNDVRERQIVQKVYDFHAKP